MIYKPFKSNLRAAKWAASQSWKKGSPWPQIIFPLGLIKTIKWWEHETHKMIVKKPFVLGDCYCVAFWSRLGGKRMPRHVIMPNHPCHFLLCETWRKVSKRKMNNGKARKIQDFSWGIFDFLCVCLTSYSCAWGKTFK